MASGIKDKVAILGMGCSKFGERWDAEAEDLMVEAFEECVADAGVDASFRVGLAVVAHRRGVIQFVTPAPCAGIRNMGVRPKTCKPRAQAAKKATSSASVSPGASSGR